MPTASAAACQPVVVADGRHTLRRPPAERLTFTYIQTQYISLIVKNCLHATNWTQLTGTESSPKPIQPLWLAEAAAGFHPYPLLCVPSSQTQRGETRTLNMCSTSNSSGKIASQKPHFNLDDKSKNYWWKIWTDSSCSTCMINILFCSQSWRQRIMRFALWNWG